MRMALRQALQDGASATLRGGLDQLVRRNLRGVWVRGSIPGGPCVWASNHHSWWDFFVAAAALRAAGRSDVGVLMDAGNVGRPELFQQVGVVGTDRLRTAVSMLRDGMVLVVFPEGELRAPGRVGPIRPGARWLADHSDSDLIPVATRVLLRGQQAAEGYLDIGLPTDDLLGSLRARVDGLDAEVAAGDPEAPLVGFTRVVAGVRSWNERFGALRG